MSTTAALLSAVLSLHALQSPFQTQQVQLPQIQVSGTAEIRVRPDEVLLSFGVVSRHASIQEAKKMNDEATARLLKFLKDQGISDREVRMDFLSVAPEQHPLQVNAIHFDVSKTFGVRLTRVEKLEEVLTGLLTNGANRMYGIEYRTSELRRHRDEARGMAVRAAREKADALAAELGVQRGAVYQISTQEGGGWGHSRSHFAGLQVAQSVAHAPDQPGDEGSSVGTISIQATVHVSFLLR